MPKNQAIFLALILSCVACGTTTSSSTPPTASGGAPSSTAKLVFKGPSALGGVHAGAPVIYSFCQPPITGNDLCQNSQDPSGGLPPYHFQLGSGVGFPPTGMTLNLNGTLTGTPTVAGTSHFSVCAVDLAASFACATVALTIDAAPASTPPPVSTSASYYYANWTCNNQSGCIELMGHNTGSAGPFCSASSCQTWENTYIRGTCDSHAIYPIYNAPPSGTCAA